MFMRECQAAGKTDVLLQGMPHNRQENASTERRRKYRKKEVDINSHIDSALKQLNLKVYPEVIKGVRGTSNKDHIPETSRRGYCVRSIMSMSTRKGRQRYDMTELPITHFKPSEIGTSVEKLKELGYTKDIDGRELKSAGR